MKLESQVSSLELSQKLKELGVPQDSLYNWLIASDGARLMNNPVLDIYRYFEQCSAFTVAELGEMLPLMFEKDGFTVSWESTKTLGGWSVYLENGNYHKMSETFKADTEADARAKMLIYLLENKLITL